MLCFVKHLGEYGKLSNLIYEKAQCISPPLATCILLTMTAGLEKHSEKNIQKTALPHIGRLSLASYLMLTMAADLRTFGEKH